MGDHPNFTGKWSVYKSENFEDFLAENGANWLVRKMASKSNPTTEIIQEGDHITIKTITLMFTKEQSFTVGEDHEDESHGPNKIKMKTSPRWEDQKLVLTLEPVNEGEAKPQKVTRELQADGDLLMTMEVGNVVCKRWYKKQPDQK